MPDAVGWTDQLRTAPNDAQDMVNRLLGTGFHARSAPDAARRVDNRCREGGSASPASRAWSRAAALRLSRSERRLTYQPRSSSDGRP